MFDYSSVPNEEGQSERVEGVEYEYSVKDITIPIDNQEKSYRIDTIQPKNKSAPPFQVMIDNRNFIAQKAMDRIKEGIEFDLERINIVAIFPLSKSDDMIMDPTGETDGFILIMIQRNKWRKFLKRCLKEMEENEDYEMCSQIHGFIQEYLSDFEDEPNSE